MVVLVGRLERAVRALNPSAPAAAIEEAVRRVCYIDVPGLVSANRALHRLLTDGVEVEVSAADGTVRGERVRLIDFTDPTKNDLAAINQFTVVDGKHKRRPDIVLFVNGLPLAVLELKNAADEDADIEDAFHQLQTYKKEISNLLAFNELLVISDGLYAKAGALTAGWERFQPWRTIDGEAIVPPGKLELETLVRGMLSPQRLLNIVKSFVVFEDDGSKIEKKVAAYHQYFAVQRAVDETLRAAKPGGDKRIGVVWHTQGSGKSLTMVLCAGRIIQHPAMENPTLVVITDRNDLDGQLFSTFAACSDALRQNPVQAQDRNHLRELLRVASGGVVFTTIQKFLPDEVGEKFPMLSDRRNIVVFADEAHRSQYGFRAKLTKGAITPGFAQHMRDALPNASFVGFTGTPIDLEDKSTRSVFGDYISVYDIKRAVEDRATVPIYYEGRFAKLDLKDNSKDLVDDEFDEVTEEEEEQRRERLKTKWAAMEAIVGDENRLKLIARDLVEHFETRNEVFAGKAMVVCMSRRICVALAEHIRALRPAWHDENDLEGEMKVIMTGSASDPESWQEHIRNKDRLGEIAKRFKNPDDSLKLVLVRDMWLTGFDAPCVHTMYVDKPMKGHGLMQAIARTNRVFREKEGGLIVDYLGLADALQRAVKTYTESGGKGNAVETVEKAVAVLMVKLENCRDLFHGFDVKGFLKAAPAERLKLLPEAAEHVLCQDDGRDRLLQRVLELSHAQGICAAEDAAIKVRNEIAFYRAVRAAVAKSTVGSSKSRAELDHAIRQIVSKAIAADGVIDIFKAAGLATPELTILSEEFLRDVKGLPQKHLAAELLHKLLHDEVKSIGKKNVVQATLFSEKLEKTIARYKNKAIQTIEVIEELMAIAREMRESKAQGKKLNLTDDEQAFYDALGTNESAVQVLGDAILTTIARELTDTLRKNVTIDWTEKEQVRAKLRSLVRRKLRQHGYPPDLQEKAVETVIKQAEVLAAEWS